MTGPSRQPGPCAVCGRPRDTETYRPFCSRRCADVDLQRWLTNRYVLPGPPSDEGGAGELDTDGDG